MSEHIYRAADRPAVKLMAEWLVLHDRAYGDRDFAAENIGPVLARLALAEQELHSKERTICRLFDVIDDEIAALRACQGDSDA